MACNHKSRPSLESTAIDIISSSTRKISSVTSFHHQANHNRNSIQNTTMAIMNPRIENRRNLHKRLNVVSNVMCFLGVFGIVLMIISNEINFIIGNDEDTFASWLIKLAISLSTIILLGLIVYYHQLDLNLYCITNSCAHWRLGLTGTRIFFITIEILVCAIHPIPRYFHSKLSLNSASTHSLSISYTSIDVALSLPICRFMKFHSHFVQNASSKSLGYLNQVSIDFFFVIKTYVEQWPTRCLIIFCTIVIFIGSWSLRACDYLPTGEHASMSDSIWLFMVTLTTVGYGDITPTSYCGRSVIVIGALVGTFTTALLISILAQALVLTRWEKYVYSFVLNIEVAKKRKIQAANVIKFTIKVWYLSRKNKAKSFQFIKAQWYLFQSIHVMQELKREQRSLIDSFCTLPDLLILQRDANSTTEKLAQQTNKMKIIIDKIDEKFTSMDQTMNNVQNAINSLLDRVH
ncbi:unnamed protein product [Rotaria magnacalcarata]|uniref:Uncharacterized protein n=1 Tax=Rotaria magnacalcarata TaxID=392030 RepID=A0A816SSH1_9BILA|nr:unnamed protein product [Rotaria magnacalcarata]CAF2092262.1 unnamed protein product [Rotaria magnacalcarata]